MKSYINNRKSMVRQEGEITVPHPIRSGVPQGSVIGPDLRSKSNSVVVTFADDTYITVSHKNLNNCLLLQHSPNFMLVADMAHKIK